MVLWNNLSSEFDHVIDPGSFTESTMFSVFQYLGFGTFLLAFRAVCIWIISIG